MHTNITEEQKLALIAALQEEYDTLPETDAFGDSNNREQYPVVIEYLNTGVEPESIPENWDILDKAINDIEGLLVDYAI